MQITAAQVKELRELTGAGIMECKKALQDANGDKEKAVELLRKRGLAKASRKKGRTANEGIVYSYIHAGGKLGAMLELNCETDFVARTDEFQALAKEIAMQIAASAPLYVSREDVPEDVLAKEREIYAEEARASGKPENVIDRIVKGKLEKFFEEFCLLDQPYIRDPEKKVRELIDEAIAKLGENIVVRRFSRFKLGESD
ncbi:MAG: translation elongation factor Ts [Synergistetes bacterium]|nr:translation elongation factor Ts [Synergistota bacterium]